MDVFDRPRPTEFRLPEDHFIRNHLGDLGRGIFIDYDDMDEELSRKILIPVTEDYNQLVSISSFVDLHLYTNDKLSLLGWPGLASDSKHPYAPYIKMLGKIVCKEAARPGTENSKSAIAVLTNAIISRYPQDPIIAIHIIHTPSTDNVEICCMGSFDPITIN